MSDNKSKFDRTFDGVATAGNSLFKFLKAIVAVIFIFFVLILFGSIFFTKSVYDDVKAKADASKPVASVSAATPQPLPASPQPAPAVIEQPPAPLVLEQQVQATLLKIEPIDYNKISSGYSGARLLFKIANDSDKTITALKVDVEVFDAFGDRIHNFYYKIEKTIPPHTTIDYKSDIVINSILQRDQLLVTTKNWKAKTIVSQVISN